MNIHHVPFYKPDISQKEIDAVEAVLRSGWITTGTVTKQFEHALAEYTGTSRFAAMNAQTNAAELCMRLLDIGPGDEVIVPAYTYSASCSIIYHVGATPVIIDSNPNSFEMDYDKMAEAITERTKMIVPVDLAGVVCEYEAIFDVVESKRHLFRPTGDIQEKLGRVIVMADTAHSLGARRHGMMAGAIADFSNFSFHAVKNLTTGEGGATTWRSLDGISDDDIYRSLMLLSLHGQTKDALAKAVGSSWEYDIVEPFYKANLTDIASALGLAQLNRYPAMLARRKEIVDYYCQRFENLDVTWLEHSGDEFESSRHLFLLNLTGKNEKERNNFIDQAAERGVMLNVHFKPLPMLSAYRKRGFYIEDYPSAYDHYRDVVSLPLYSSMTDYDVEYVVDTLTDLLHKINKT